MKKTFTTLLFLSLSCLLMAGSGGPDAYGYTWKDSDEPDGPTYQWTDITSTGMLVNGLGDDNVVGPFVLATNFNFYWYQVKKVWIGSNGYIAFGNHNIAAAFPQIPTPGGGNDFVAGLMSDLNFTGTGNNGECWFFDDTTKTIVSYIDVPFWNAVPPFHTGSNTFQIVLNKLDSTITVHYQTQTGLTQGDDIKIGIENVTGDIGLQHSNNVYPPTGYAIRFYNPSQPLIDIADAAVSWITDFDNAAYFVKQDGPDVPLIANFKNTGNLSLSNFNTSFEVQNYFGSSILTDSWPVDSLEPAIDTTIFYPSAFTPAQDGVYSFISTLSGIPNEFSTTNNIRVQEVVVVDTTQLEMELGFTGGQDDGIGIAWNGGDGGIAVYYEPPFYPAFAASTRFRIASNIGNAGFAAKIYDDDGPDGGPGTLLDSVYVPNTQVNIGGPTDVPLANPFFINDGGVYVQWKMGGANINLARDVVAPFSLRTYEVLSGIWAEYRDRETEDFYIHLVLTQPPAPDGGATQFFGIANGSVVSNTISVRTWVKNFGNVAITDVEMNYQYANDPVVTEMYSGTMIQPGDSALYTFNTQLTPAMDGMGNVCAWTNLVGDIDPLNDTICVSIEMVTGIEEQASLSFDILPNPASDQVWVRPNAEWNGPVVIEVCDLLGSVVHTKEYAQKQAQFELDLGQLTEGTYLLQVRSRTGRFTKRFVKLDR